VSRLRWFSPLLAFSLGACAWWMAGRPSLQALDRLIFSHALHAENDVECTDCHEGIEASSVLASHIPAEEVCLECHDREENCGMCHTNPENHRPRQWSTRVAFSHEKHLSQEGVSCETCHGAIMEVGTSQPGHDVCLSCHEHAEQYAQATCLGCHPTMREMPLRAIAEFDHAGDWMTRHGLRARSQATTCAQCHTESACNDCHSNVAPATNFRLFPEETGRSLLHRGDFTTTHSIEARLDGATCLRCHQNPGYCEACHRQNGVAADGTASRVPHPPGWALRGGQFHGDAARVRIETCAACHDQGAASGCVGCHQVGGVGGSPHPAGWNRSRAEIVDNSMCQICHL
jgi:hypothetical protein